MERIKIVTSNTPLKEIAFADISALAILSRFGIRPGFGNKKVGEVSEQLHIDLNLLTLALNVFLGISLKTEDIVIPAEESTVDFLKLTDEAYNRIQLPNIMRHFMGSITSSDPMGKYLNQLVTKFDQRRAKDSDILFPILLNREDNRINPGIVQEFIDLDQGIENELSDLIEFLIVYQKSDFDPNLLLGALTTLESTYRDVQGVNRIRRLLITTHMGVEENLDYTAQGNGGETEKIKRENDIQLTAREKEVLTQLANGLSNKEVADRLCISINTAITHRRNIIAKLGIKSLAGLSLYAYTHGLLKSYV